MVTTFGPATPLGQVRAWLTSKINDGAKCPCCGQFAKVYRRRINAGMARSLISMYRAGGTTFIHLPTVIDARSREEGKLRYWGLVEEQVGTRPDGGRAGYWRVTHAGELFVLGKAYVEEYALVYDGRCLGLDGALVDIRQALGRRFDYTELMRS